MLSKRVIPTRSIVHLFCILLLFLLLGSPVFALSIPAFESVVRASSSVSNMQEVALESSLRSSLVSADGSGPGEVHYMVSISGINGSAAGGAVGSAKTALAVSILEGRDTLLNHSAAHEWKDTTEVHGTIANLRKTFDYSSGIRL